MKTKAGNELLTELAELRANGLKGKSEEEFIDICFLLIRYHPEFEAQCRAAVMLSGVVKKGLGARTKEFLDQNPSLPLRVNEVLRSSILRMETF